MLTTTFHFGFLARQVLFPVLLAGAASAATAQSPDRSEISQLFVQVKVNASVLSIDAGNLESYTRSQADWKSPARQLEMIRDHLDGFLGDLNRLKNVRSQGATWQQETIDSIEPARRSAAYELIGTMELMGQERSSPAGAGIPGSMPVPNKSCWTKPLQSYAAISIMARLKQDQSLLREI